MIHQIEQKKDEALVKIKNNLLLCHVQQDRVHQISHTFNISVFMIYHMFMLGWKSLW